MFRPLDVATSAMATAARFGFGFKASHPATKQPERLLELYEFEGCPFCRKVREALTTFDLDALVHPCPKNGARFRPEVERRGGKAQFPWLVDPNTGEALYESDAIIRYLADHYGDGSIPLASNMGPVTIFTSSFASLWRLGIGTSARPSKRPEKPLELWSFEASPYCRLAREALCSLELPYVLHNVGRGSSKRNAFKERSGKMMVPYLVDPNTGAAMFESADIVRYLESTYGA
jgi:glutathione S-transferase